MPIGYLYPCYMKANKTIGAIRLKYTQHLINNKNLAEALEPSPYYIIAGFQSALELVRTVYLLGFCAILFPFAVVIDCGRLVYCFQLKTSRRLKQVPLIYNFRKTTGSLWNMRNRFAYLFIQKTNNPIA